jgi:hypothetical protein
MAIREIEHHPLTAVKKIMLARQFDIRSSWALNAYTELCNRPEALTMQEASELGLQTAVRISQLRERLRKTPGRRNSLPPAPISRGPAKRAGSPGEHSRVPTRAEFVLDSAARIRARPTAEKVPRIPASSRLVAEAFDLVGVGGVV